MWGFGFFSSKKIHICSVYFSENISTTILNAILLLLTFLFNIVTVSIGAHVLIIQCVGSLMNNLIKFCEAFRGRVEKRNISSSQNVSGYKSDVIGDAPKNEIPVQYSEGKVLKKF